MYQSAKAVTVDDLDEILERTRRIEKKPPQKPPVIDEYRKINIHAVKTHKGRWVKILLKDGLKQEGKIVDVKEKEIELQKSYTFGSFSISVAIQQIEETRLLVHDGRANNRQ